MDLDCSQIDYQVKVKKLALYNNRFQVDNKKTRVVNNAQGKI